MTRLATLLICVLAGCMTEVEGDPGVPGPPGEQGPAGPGLGLVWKDATGAIVPNAFVLYQDRKFAMLVRDENGVFFDVSPTSGAFYNANISKGAPFYLTTNCTGEAHHIVNIAPRTAFQLDGRVVALPLDVAVATTARSYVSPSSSSCTGISIVESFISGPTLTSLPTLTPPTLRPGPYHVDQR